MTTQRNTRKLIIHITGILALLSFWCSVIFLVAALNGKATWPLLITSVSVAIIGVIVCAIDYRHVTR